MKLRQGFEGIEFLSVEDVSDGCGDKLKIIIVTDAFEGIKLVDRHRMVNGSKGVLKNIMDIIHAMELKTWTKAQYVKKKKK
jgi:stress-induced morphogen